MAGGIDDVDMRDIAVVLPLDTGALGKDGYPALFLQVIGIHSPFLDPLVVAEGPRLAKQLVDQRGLAVVDVGDDGDIAQAAGHERLSRCAGAAHSCASRARP